MNSYSVKHLMIQDVSAEANTYYKAPKVAPSIRRVDEFSIQVKTIDHECIITRLEEVIFMIICDFKFAPLWLVKQWFESENEINGVFDENLDSWINTGLIWTETSATGVYLRPTRFLLDMFQEEVGDFIEIPYNTLTHTVSEEQVMFDISIGNKNNELYYRLSKDNILPPYSPLDLKERITKGTVVLREAKFRFDARRQTPEDFIDSEAHIMEQIKNKEAFTDEFADFSKFAIIHKRENGELAVQSPDICVPLARTNGEPQSYAIEIELTPKSILKYKEILESYKNNIKFGKLIYLCAPGRISKRIRAAYKKMNEDLGTTKLELLEFEVPAVTKDYYLEKNITKQEKFKENEEKEKAERQEQIKGISDFFGEVQQSSDEDISNLIID